jgi:hypothetical protein
MFEHGLKGFHLLRSESPNDPSFERVTDEGEGQMFGPYKIFYRADFSLDQNFPNPFNPTTKIRFTTAEDSHARLIVYDVAGRVVRTLVNDRLRADHYELVWDGKNNSGRHVSSGVYFYQLKAGKFTKTRKMLMLK